MEHIKKLAQTIAEGAAAKNLGDPHMLSKALARELDTLVSSEFAPNARLEFVLLRQRGQAFASASSFGDLTKLGEWASKVAKVMDHYGVGLLLSGRTFKWLTDADLRVIIERDYLDLSVKLVPDGAWKSAVVMAGSIVEAILFDLMTKNPKWSTPAHASAKVPKKGVTPVPDDKWRLADLIEIAADIGLFDGARKETFDRVLRDYRNFVHPRVEIRNAHPCGEGEAYMAKGALDAVCDHFNRTL
jgi:hypothetical protein